MTKLGPNTKKIKYQIKSNIVLFYYVYCQILLFHCVVHTVFKFFLFS